MLGNSSPNLMELNCFVIQRTTSVFRDLTYLDLMIWTAIMIIIICFTFWVAVHLRVSIHTEEKVALRARRSAHTQMTAG